MPSHVQQLLGEGFDLVTEREWWRHGVLHRENDRPAVLLTSLPPFGKYCDFDTCIRARYWCCVLARYWWKDDVMYRAEELTPAVPWQKEKPRVGTLSGFTEAEEAEWKRMTDHDRLCFVTEVASQ